MPGLERMQTLDLNIDAVSRKVQELRGRRTATLDAALNVVDENSGRTLPRSAAGLSLDGLAGELAAQSSALHDLDVAHLVDLLSDPFDA